MSIPPSMVYDNKSAKIAGVSLPIVSTGFLFSILNAQPARVSIGLGSTLGQAEGSSASPVRPSPAVSDIEPYSIEIILVDSAMSS